MEWRATNDPSQRTQTVGAARDTTIYEMEQRGEFPRRFNLTSRCVVWYLAEVEAWIEQRCKNSYAAPAVLNANESRLRGGGDLSL